MKKERKFYVTMTDRFLSGWGLCRNKVSKFIVECDSWAQALEIYTNARHENKEMKYINTTNNISKYYNNSRFHVSLKHYSECLRFHNK